MHRDAASSLPGIVEKVIRPAIPGYAEKVQISIQSGDDPSQKIRIANTFNALGETVALKRGAPVRIVIRQKPKDTI
jgi:hypothetical protein